MPVLPYVYIFHFQTNTLTYLCYLSSYLSYINNKISLMLYGYNHVYFCYYEHIFVRFLLVYFNLLYFDHIKFHNL